jgi:hypothetical protein
MKTGPSIGGCCLPLFVGADMEAGKAVDSPHGEHVKENVNSADDQHILEAAQEGRTFGGPAGPEERGDASDEDESSESDDRSTDSEHDDNSGRLSIPAPVPSASPPGVPKLSMTHLRDASAQAASSSSSSSAAATNEPKAAPPSVGIHRQMHDSVC